MDLLIKRQCLDKPNGRVLFARIKGDLVDLARNDAAKLKHRTGAAGFAQKISELSSTIAFETPRCVFQIFFGIRDGAEVYARWYKPIEENNRNKNLFLAQHTEKIREAAGGKWSKEEQQVGQMLIEARLYGITAGVFFFGLIPFISAK